MTQTSNRFFDEIGRLMNDAAGAAQGVKREVDTVVRNQAERILRDLDIVKREEFEAVKDMARLAREENEALKARIAALEAKLGIRIGAGSGSLKTVGEAHPSPFCTAKGGPAEGLRPPKPQKNPFISLSFPPLWG
jgi:BMFP domain-containing protein YqiC